MKIIKTKSKSIEKFLNIMSDMQEMTAPEDHLTALIQDTLSEVYKEKPNITKTSSMDLSEVNAAGTSTQCHNIKPEDLLN